MNLFDAYIYDYKRLLVFTKEADIVVQNINGSKFDICETGIESRDFECWFNPVLKRAVVKTFDERLYVMKVYGMGLKKKVKFFKKNLLNAIVESDKVTTLEDKNIDFLKYSAREIAESKIDELQ